MDLERSSASSCCAGTPRSSPRLRYAQETQARSSDRSAVDEGEARASRIPRGAGSATVAGVALLRRGRGQACAARIAAPPGRGPHGGDRDRHPRCGRAQPQAHRPHAAAQPARSSSPACPARASRRSRSTRSTPRGSGATSSRCRPTRGSSSSRWRSPTSSRSRACRPRSRSSRRRPSRNPRSTVGTVTEIYDYLRLLFARVGRPHCHQCGKPIASQSVQQIVDAVLALPEGTQDPGAGPDRARTQGHLQEGAARRGARRGSSARASTASVRELGEEIELDKQKKHTIEIVVDRLVVRPDLTGRLTDSVETALGAADGLVVVDVGRQAGPAVLAPPGLPDVRRLGARAGAADVLVQLAVRRVPRVRRPGRQASRSTVEARLVLDPDKTLRDGALAWGDAQLVPDPRVEPVPRLQGRPANARTRSCPPPFKKVLWDGAGDARVRLPLAGHAHRPTSAARRGTASCRRSSGGIATRRPKSRREELERPDGGAALPGLRRARGCGPRAWRCKVGGRDDRASTHGCRSPRRRAVLRRSSS